MSIFWFLTIVVLTSTHLKHKLKLIFLSIFLAASVLTKFSGMFLIEA
ncbi:MAG: hypothetical protein NT149_01700 [Candidatus Gottesmanbacteria bacterium]|nr:hypothetical protein [Candidatus Gottesmanbacteria bacterium]